MTTILFSGILFLVAYLAGILGALTGLGGGVIIIPVLVIAFGVNIYYAMGASLISVIATSSGAAIAYLHEGYTNLRIGIFLETSAVIGAFLGTVLVLILNANLIAIIFGIVLLISAFLTWNRKEESEINQSSHPWATFMRLDDVYPSLTGPKHYQVKQVPLAWCIMFIAGTLSSLLGIGSGALKVLAMDHVMGLPFKVATATSNFIIGITATVGAGVYFSRGYIDPGLTFPIVIGVLLGALSGAKILSKIDSRILRIIFSIVIILLALEMIYKGFGGHL
jgi:hypothetical protein